MMVRRFEHATPIQIELAITTLNKTWLMISSCTFGKWVCPWFACGNSTAGVVYLAQLYGTAKHSGSFPLLHLSHCASGSNTLVTLIRTDTTQAHGC